ncbi:hypothetical protein Lal_00006888, partial [Lupinus albus]
LSQQIVNEFKCTVLHKLIMEHVNRTIKLRTRLHSPQNLFALDIESEVHDFHSACDYPVHLMYLAHPLPGSKQAANGRVPVYHYHLKS